MNPARDLLGTGCEGAPWCVMGSKNAVSTGDPVGHAASEESTDGSALEGH
eukprot:XP_001707623.1 Hypothetical protein GL50803_106941 [Giardia lamblia ATCC 50803]